MSDQMDIIDQAIYDLIHGYKGGAPALSRDLYSDYGYQVSPGTLMNKANPDQTHQLTTREGDLIQRKSQRFNLLHASAHRLNHSVVKLGDFSKTSDIEFLNTYTEMHEQIGNLASVINKAFKDNLITRKELKAVRIAGMASIRSILEMEVRMRALCDEYLEFDDE